ncbi:ATP-binding protein [Streptomyces sp. Tu 6176]|uniref:ATP-binding protein n=1 Tax=Streptomyces sp. Tu 6176 TaxID=1470557 RepID=UPI001F210189|nr:ATP-binding protein [Streptomyces sp. Tu 6176]
MDETGLNSPSGEGVRGETGLGHVSVTLDRATVRIADARAFAADYLAASVTDDGRPLPEGVAAAVQLVVSELITNTVKYGSGPIELTLDSTGGTLSVTVRDGDTTLPTPRLADPARVGQHGLEIVAALSREVEIQREPDGKRITAYIALDRPPGDG